MAWYEEFNAVFFLSVGSLLIAILAFCFKSKCSECSLCGGLLRVVRDVQAENEEQQFEITHPHQEEKV